METLNNNQDNQPQPPIDIVPTSVVHDGTPKKKNYLPWLLAILVLAAIIYINYSNNRTKTPSLTIQPTIYPTPQSTPTALPRYQDPWQKYESGQNIDGITINYPQGWKINYTREYNLVSDYKAKYRLQFDFAPPGWNPSSGTVMNDWMGWGTIYFDVYNPQIDVNQWINKYAPKFKNDLTIKEGTKIGGKPTSQIQSNVSQFGALLIFGSNYTYDLSHSQNGSTEPGGFVEDWTVIFQYINID